MGFDKKVIAAIVLLAVGAYVVAPGLFSVAALPLLLFVVVCPLSMLLMMKMMMPGSSNESAAGPARADDDELRALREEIDQLRAEQPRRERHPSDPL